VTVDFVALLVARLVVLARPALPVRRGGQPAGPGEGRDRRCAATRSATVSATAGSAAATGGESSSPRSVPATPMPSFRLTLARDRTCFERMAGPRRSWSIFSIP